MREVFFENSHRWIKGAQTHNFPTCQTKPHSAVALLQDTSLFSVSYDPEISVRVWIGEHVIVFSHFFGICACDQWIVRTCYGLITEAHFENEAVISRQRRFVLFAQQCFCPIRHDGAAFRDVMWRVNHPPILFALLSCRPSYIYYLNENHPQILIKTKTSRRSNCQIKCSSFGLHQWLLFMTYIIFR
jgi:hypothetical protein